MNIKEKTAILILIITGFTSCKKEKQNQTNAPTPTPTPIVKTSSKMELLNQIWVLKETFEDGVQKTSNGTDKYEFNKYGSFRSEFSGRLHDIGTYKFTTKDSNELEVTLKVEPSPYTWKLLKLDAKLLKTEFISGTKKINYIYTR